MDVYPTGADPVKIPEADRPPVLYMVNLCLPKREDIAIISLYKSAWEDFGTDQKVSTRNRSFISHDSIMFVMQCSEGVGIPEGYIHAFFVWQKEEFE